MTYRVLFFVLVELAAPSSDGLLFECFREFPHGGVSDATSDELLESVVHELVLLLKGLVARNLKQTGYSIIEAARLVVR